ncbi:MAG: sigma-70 family RNA polymerase sigma factor [Candidatus Buchananbacteria bacterium]|nr:sigma-70 family RNA polymerase sigma factor [Candidatus Buchananbacteria bacterium]
MAFSEQQVISQCQQGQLDGFGQLYDLYIKKIYNFIYYKTHHQQTAEDLTSQTFLKALSKINQFDINKGYFSTWLYQIARNTVIDHYRTSHPEIDIQDVWDLASDSDIAKDTEIKTQLKEVEKYLNQLDSAQREIIILRVWEQMSYKEIAEIVGKSEASCKMMFLRSLEKLRNHLPLAIYLLLISRF